MCAARADNSPLVFEVRQLDTHRVCHVGVLEFADHAGPASESGLGCAEGNTVVYMPAWVMDNLAAAPGALRGARGYVVLVTPPPTQGLWSSFVSVVTWGVRGMFGCSQRTARS